MAIKVSYLKLLEELTNDYKVLVRIQRKKQKEPYEVRKTVEFRKANDEINNSINEYYKKYSNIKLRGVREYLKNEGNRVEYLLINYPEVRDSNTFDIIKVNLSVVKNKVEQGIEYGLNRTRPTIRIEYLERFHVSLRNGRNTDTIHGYKSPSSITYYIEVPGNGNTYNLGTIGTDLRILDKDTYNKINSEVSTDMNKIKELLQ